VIYRQQRPALACFAVFLLAVVLYRFLAPAYQAEMSVLVRHGVGPVAAWGLAAPRLEPDEVIENELDSEVELLHGQEILGTRGKGRAPGFCRRILVRRNLVLKTADALAKDS
jgi:uncharacterized protein involved in exopolysaccharide biosynthesis